MPASNNNQGSGAGGTQGSGGGGNVLPYPTPPTPKKPWEKTGNVWSDHEIAAWFHGEGLSCDYCFVPQRDLWRRYDGTRWIEDFVHLDAAIMGFMASIRHHCKKPRDREKLGSASKVSSVKKILRTLRSRDEEQWDNDPALLNCPTCTVNLSLLALQRHQAHDREDYITKITRADPANVLYCPLWLDHVDFCAIGRTGLIEYLQTLTGSALIGELREQMFAFFHGGGGNGKGVYIDTLLHVLGDYATTVDPDVFTEQRFRQHPEEMMCLRGARLIVSTEIPTNAKWNEARLKAVTGGDMIVARGMRENSIRFAVEGTLIFTGNDKPTLHRINDAIKRRMHLVPFDAKIDEEKFDSRIRDKLKLEAAGVLQWLIDGCMKYQYEGKLPVPEEVEIATADYLSDEDQVRQWIDDCCDWPVLDTLRTKRTILFASWKAWCIDNNVDCGGPNSLYTQLKDRLKIRQWRDAKGRYFCGITVKAKT